MIRAGVMRAGVMRAEHMIDQEKPNKNSKGKEIQGTRINRIHPIGNEQIERKIEQRNELRRTVERITTDNHR